DRLWSCSNGALASARSRANEIVIRHCTRELCLSYPPRDKALQSLSALPQHSFFEKIEVLRLSADHPLPVLPVDEVSVVQGHAGDRRRGEHGQLHPLPA